MKKLFRFITIIAFAYVIIITLAFSLQTTLFFHPEKLSESHKFDSTLPSQEVFLTTPDGEKINGLFFSAQHTKVILYFHGNAGSLNSWQYVYEDFRVLGYNFFIIDYRGFGKSTGDISERGLYMDAQTAYEYLLGKGFAANNIIVYGRSIGSGVAVNVAADKNINALILEAPLISAKKIATEKFPYLFPSLYLKYKFDSIEKINNVKAPLLIIHGTRDTIIPAHHGQRLYEKFEGKKTMLLIDGGHHNDLSEFPEFSEGVARFIAPGV